MSASETGQAATEGTRSVEAVDDREPILLQSRTAWSFLSSLAIHTSSIAVVLFTIVAFQQPPPRGLVEMESVNFIEDGMVAQRGGSAEGEQAKAVGDSVEETEEVAPQQAESGLPEPAVDVSEALDASSGEALAESEDRVKASEAGLRAERAARKAVVENMARRGKDDASALSAKIAAAERAAARKVETSGVTLKRPGQNTDGSTLFSVVGSNQVVFIIDTSGSMGAVLPLEDGGQIRALDYVKLELAGVIRRQLSDENLFNLVPFSSDARPWRRRLVRANKDGKRSAIDYVAQFQPAGGTNLTAALYSAFNMEDVRTIYVLSDGQPSSATTTILRRVKQLNSRREIIIHTIAFCVSAGPREFLRSLALQNGGLFRAFP